MMTEKYNPRWREEGYAHCIALAHAETVRDAVMGLLDLMDVLERAGEHDLHARRILGQVRAYLRRRAGFLSDVIQ